MARYSSPPLQLVVNNDGCTNRQTITLGQAIVKPTGASENNRRQKDARRDAAVNFFPPVM